MKFDFNGVYIILGILCNTLILLQPILKLNNTITRLDVTIQNLEREFNEALRKLEDRVRRHGEEIDRLRFKE